MTSDRFPSRAPSAPPEPPPTFLSDLDRAAANGQIGMLGLLEHESASYPWHTAAAERIASELTKIAVPWRWNHAILFTGHMIDAPSRKQPRFPATAEPAAREAILHRVESLTVSRAGPVVGIAGAASGGDLLFHEACAQLGMDSLVRLALPPADYIIESVSPAGQSWVRRFETLLNRVGSARVEVLGESTDLPSWMGPRPDYDVWQRTNLWLVSEATAAAPMRSLLSLWDGKTGDGPGGTEHLVKAAPRLGIATVELIGTSAIVEAP